MLTWFRCYTDISIALFAYIFRLRDIAILAAGISGSTFSFGRVINHFLRPISFSGKEVATLSSITMLVIAHGPLNNLVFNIEIL